MEGIREEGSLSLGRQTCNRCHMYRAQQQNNHNVVATLKTLKKMRLKNVGTGLHLCPVEKILLYFS